MSTSSGYKRVRDDAPSFEGGLPYGDDTPASVAAGNGDASRKEKPKDWRQAFLDEDAAQERRERERRREGNGSRGHERERERERSRDRGGRSHRDRSERASSRTDSRPSKPTNSRPARLDMDGEAEEGEIPDVPLPAKRRQTRSPSPPYRRRQTRSPSPPPRESHPNNDRYRPPPPGRGRGGYQDNNRGGYRGGDRGGRGRGGYRGGRGGGGYGHPYPHPADSRDRNDQPPAVSSSKLPAPPSPPKTEAPKVVVPEIIEEIEDVVELDPEEALAERRRKRAEIMAKHSAAPSSASSARGTPAPMEVAAIKVEKFSGGVSAGGSSPALSRGISPALPSNPADPSNFSLAKEDETAVPDESSSHAFQSAPNEAEEVSAADYDAAADQRAEDIRRMQHESTLVSKTAEVPLNPEEKVEEVLEMGDEDEDDEDDDMFSGVIKPKRKVVSTKQAFIPPAPLPTTSAATLSDNWDDADGYYRIMLGEVVDNGRYQIFSNLGKGMFSAVVRARVVKPSPGQEVGKEVAIKIIRSQESMFKAGQKEVQILNRLMAADPDDKKHLIRLEGTFEHRGHLCMVFESLSMNLRDVIKRFGKDVGLNIKAVRAYAHQMFLALSLMKKCTVMHADIKPDNILVTENKATLKICDLGSASDESEMDITPYLVSRFYRAPEIILGLPYDCSLDVWSIGCTLFELYTGKILFPGRTNNQMLLHMMELKGRFNQKMVKKSQFGAMHFEQEGSGGFLSVELDKITGQNTTRTVVLSKPTRDLKARLLPSSSAQLKMKDDELKLLLSFVDLLDKCLALDPAKRITPREALVHPFMRS